MKQREIKFKAWHKEEKLLCRVSTITDNGAFLIGVKKGKDEIKDRMIVYAPDDGRFCKTEEIELMQYTGLEDRNGKEIYEDDIVEATHPNMTELFVGKIKYDAESTRYELLVKGNSWTLSEFDEIEVMGNIYENAGLLAVAPFAACQ